MKIYLWLLIFLNLLNVLYISQNATDNRFNILSNNSSIHTGVSQFAEKEKVQNKPGHQEFYFDNRSGRYGLK
jgi:hypothetical protein